MEQFELPSAYEPVQQLLQVDVDGDVRLIHDDGRLTVGIVLTLKF